MRIRLLFFFLASLAFAQDVPALYDGKLHAGDGCLADPECGGAVKRAERLQEQAAADKQEIQRLTTLLNWYQQQFFLLQARQIEQQVAPVKPKPKVDK